MSVSSYNIGTLRHVGSLFEEKIKSEISKWLLNFNSVFNQIFKSPALQETCPATG
jgi:hypothetical protein